MKPNKLFILLLLLSPILFAACEITPVADKYDIVDGFIETKTYRDYDSEDVCDTEGEVYITEYVDLFGGYPADASGYVFDLDYSSNFFCEWYAGDIYLGDIDGYDDKTASVQVEISFKEDGIYCLSTDMVPGFGADEDLLIATIYHDSGAENELPLVMPKEGSVIEGFWDGSSGSNCTEGDYFRVLDGPIEISGSDVMLYGDETVLTRIEREWLIVLEPN
jgi:hypothetical protein